MLSPRPGDVQAILITPGLACAHKYAQKSLLIAGHAAVSQVNGLNFYPLL